MTSETYNLASKIEGEAQRKIKAAEERCAELRTEAEELVRANREVTQQEALKYANKLEQQLKEQEEALACRERARACEMQRIFEERMKEIENVRNTAIDSEKQNIYKQSALSEALEKSPKNSKN